jgi:hypothetical protein
LEGTYAGAWTMYGIDDKGEVVKKMAWTDVLKAAKAEVKAGRAQVTTVDEMAFEGSKGPPFKIEGKEGYLLTSDGRLGGYFIEMFGQVHQMVKVSNNVWTYATQAAEQELTRLGFPKGATGEHVVVKVVAQVQGIETHRISRITTARWKDKEGNEQTLQYVSLRGYHKRG